MGTAHQPVDINTVATPSPDRDLRPTVTSGRSSGTSTVPAGWPLPFPASSTPTRIARRSWAGTAAPIGSAGGEVDVATESRIRTSSGAPIEASTRHAMEQAFDTDFADVRIHQGDQVDDLNRSLSAQAFTVGSEIFLSGDTAEPSSDEGRRLLAHELTHVVQQRTGRASRIVRRAVGFEFEDESWSVFQTQPGMTLRNPDAWNLRGGRVAPPGSEKTAEEIAADPFTGKNIWAGGVAGSHINSKIGKFNLRTASKKGKLHTGNGFAIEPDGPITGPGGVSNRMDLEFVTEPFPETADGLLALDAALRDMRDVFNRIEAYSSGVWDGEEFDYDKLIGPRQHGFTSNDVYLYGGIKRGSFKPQVTSGIPLGKLAEVMKTLGGGVQETEDEANERQQIRTLAYGTEGSPELLAASATTRIIGRAPALAQAVVDRLGVAGSIPADATGRGELVGFLSLALVYMVVLSVTSKDGVKTQMPFLSRYSFATLYRQIPPALRNTLSGDALMTALDPELKTGLREFLQLKYRRESEREVVEERSSDGLGGPMIRAFLKETVEGREQRATVLETGLGSFTRRQWLQSVIAGGDLLKPSDLVQRLAASANEVERRAASDYGKSAAIFLRGHANTSNVRDVADEAPGSLALLENRNITEGPITIDQAQTLAMTYFSWLRRLKDS